MAGAFLERDLAAILSSADFGGDHGTVTLEGVVIPYGIFDAEDQEYQLGEGVEQIIAVPTFTCRWSDVTAIADGQEMRVDGVRYTVKSWMNDATGMVTITLEKQF